MSLVALYIPRSSKGAALGHVPFEQGVRVLHWRRVMWYL